MPARWAFLALAEYLGFLGLVLFERHCLLPFGLALVRGMP
jgi:hypothetical protein